jgi:5-bromo-4-chloroindolyl phosphate hydrolysis protein
MAKFLTTPAAYVVLLLAILGVLVAVGFYIIGKVRQDLTEGAPGASELLSKFRELHSQGGLSDKEYRTIKAMLAERLENDLKIGNKEDINLKAKGIVRPDKSAGADEPA